MQSTRLRDLASNVYKTNLLETHFLKLIYVKLLSNLLRKSVREISGYLK